MQWMIRIRKDPEFLPDPDLVSRNLIRGRERELISFKHQENINQIDANRHKNKLSQ
jgi:hypothetical protein